MDNAQKNIVILGGGFGGVASVLKLTKLLDTQKKLNQKYQIILVDKNNTQTYIPALYEVGSTIKDEASAYELKCCVGIPYEQIFKNKPIRFLQAKIQKIDTARREVVFEGKEQSTPFEYLVLALGSVTNYFNIPGLEEYSHPLKTYEDALHLRNELENLFAERLPSINFVIGGAGLTGIEIAGEIGSLIKRLEKKYKMSDKYVGIFLIEAGPEILPGMNPKLIKATRARLDKLGIKIFAGRKIVKTENDKVFLDDNTEFNNSFLVWTGGVKPSPILATTGLNLSPKGSVLVNEFLQTQDPKIYVAGDAAYFINKKTGQPLVWTAPTAIAEGKCAARNIFSQVTQRPIKPFRPREFPIVMPIGQKFALAFWHGFVISGFLIWVFKHLIMLDYLLGILPFFQALKIWLRQMKVYVKND